MIKLTIGREGLPYSEFLRRRDFFLKIRPELIREVITKTEFEDGYEFVKEVIITFDDEEK